MSAQDYADYATRVMKSGSPAEEKGVCVRWAAARHLMDEAEREVEGYFMPLLRDRLDAGDFESAEELVRRFPPDTVTKVFMMDQLRQARRK